MLFSDDDDARGGEIGESEEKMPSGRRASVDGDDDRLVPSQPTPLPVLAPQKPGACTR